MIKLMRTPATAVWIFLMAATLVSWWLGLEVSHSTIAVMAIAYIKSLLVGMIFMELLHAPRVLSYAFLAWCVLGLSGIVGIYLMG